MKPKSADQAEREAFSILSQLLYHRTCYPLFRFLWEKRDPPLSPKALALHLYHCDDPATLNKLYKTRWDLERALGEFNERQRQGHLPHVLVELPAVLRGQGYQLRISHLPAYKLDAGDLVHTGKPAGWRPFTWVADGSDPREVPIHVWTPRRGNTFAALQFDVLDPWRKPKGFSGYARHRQECRRRLEAEGRRVTDGHVWRVSKVNLENDATLRIAVQPCRYLDYHATCLSLNTQITLNDGCQSSIRRWLAPNWTGGFLESFYPAANSLAVNLLIETREGLAVIVQQSATHGVSALEWVASVSGVMKYRGDSRSLSGRRRVPDPVRTAYLEASEEVGIEIREERIKWVGFGVGLNMGTPCLLGEVKTQLSKDALHRAFYADREDPIETRHVDFKKLDPGTVLSVLKDHVNYKHRSYFELGLALALVRRGLATRVV